MQGPIKERWRDLCERAATEQDPKKLMPLVKEINQLLEEKQSRLAMYNGILKRWWNLPMKYYSGQKYETVAGAWLRLDREH
jgi:hypothetical protein